MRLCGQDTHFGKCQIYPQSGDSPNRSYETALEEPTMPGGQIVDPTSSEKFLRGTSFEL